MVRKKIVELCLIVSRRELARNVFEVTLQSREIAPLLKPGNFVNLKCGPAQTLRRPISVCSWDASAGLMTLAIEIKGEGTRYLSSLKPGDFIDVFGPLGNAFSLHKNKKVLIVGGGIGVFPLYELARIYKESAAVALGFRDKDAAVYAAEFESTGAQVYFATDDGSLGKKGNAVTLAKELAAKSSFDFAYACGPKPMLRAFKELVSEKNINIKTELSLEERMGCGIGACLVCACDIINSKGETVKKHVCSDGPVFDAESVVL